MPDSLSSSQCLGALRRFWCFLAVHQTAVSIVVRGISPVDLQTDSPLDLQDCKQSSAIAPGRQHPVARQVGFGIEGDEKVRGVP